MISYNLGRCFRRLQSGRVALKRKEATAYDAVSTPRIESERERASERERERERERESPTDPRATVVRRQRLEEQKLGGGEQLQK
ncbi:hypothetical protein AOLI_G00284960 [Acnodon oligacanthus]